MTLTKNLIENTINTALLVTYPEHSNMRMGKIVMNDSAHLAQIEIHGGLNGRGNQKEYNYDIHNFMTYLKSHLNGARIVDTFNDKPDDVFTLTVEVR
jgi:hypothetical protein